MAIEERPPPVETSCSQYGDETVSRNRQLIVLSEAWNHLTYGFVTTEAVKGIGQGG